MMQKKIHLKFQIQFINQKGYKQQISSCFHSKFHFENKSTEMASILVLYSSLLH
jgi:hypothetical protein